MISAALASCQCSPLHNLSSNGLPRRREGREVTRRRKQELILASRNFAASLLRGNIFELRPSSSTPAPPTASGSTATRFGRSSNSSAPAAWIVPARLKPRNLTTPAGPRNSSPSSRWFRCSANPFATRSNPKTASPSSAASRHWPVISWAIGIRYKGGLIARHSDINQDDPSCPLWHFYRNFRDNSGF